MAREMDYNNLRGIESWYKQHREWVKKGRPEKYTEEEKTPTTKKSAKSASTGNGSSQKKGTKK